MGDDSPRFHGLMRRWRVIDCAQLAAMRQPAGRHARKIKNARECFGRRLNINAAIRLICRFWAADDIFDGDIISRASFSNMAAVIADIIDTGASPRRGDESFQVKKEGCITIDFHEYWSAPTLYDYALDAPRLYMRLSAGAALIRSARQHIQLLYRRLMQCRAAHSAALDSASQAGASAPCRFVLAGAAWRQQFATGAREARMTNARPPPPAAQYVDSFTIRCFWRDFSPIFHKTIQWISFKRRRCRLSRRSPALCRRSLQNSRQLTICFYRLYAASIFAEADMQATPE